MHDVALDIARTARTAAAAAAARRLDAVPPRHAGRPRKHEAHKAVMSEPAEPSLLVALAAELHTAEHAFARLCTAKVDPSDAALSARRLAALARRMHRLGRVIAFVERVDRGPSSGTANVG